jgi:hypothetical protein
MTASISASSMGYGVYPTAIEDSVFERETKDKVAANVANKLLGTSGGTIVFRHNGSISTNIRAEMEMRDLQKAMRERFGRITTTVPTGLIERELIAERAHLASIEKDASQAPQFLDILIDDAKTVSYRPMDEASTGFVSIRNLHTTIISRNVVDTKEGIVGWDHLVDVTKYFRGVFSFVDKQEDSTTYKFSGDAATYTKAMLLDKFAACANKAEAEELLTRLEITADTKRAIQDKADEPLVEDPTKLQEIPSFELIAKEIKVTDNGSVVVQWGASDELVRLKRALVDFGAIAKRGLYGNMCGTTVGFFPNYHKLPKEKRAELEAFIKDFVAGKEPLKIVIDPVKLSDVRFERNDLNAHFSKFTKLIDDETSKVSGVRDYHLGMKKPID